MDIDSLLTISEAGRRLGEKKPTRILALIRANGIPTRRVGSALVIDAEGFATLKRALDAWRNRPRLYSQKATASR